MSRAIVLLPRVAALLGYPTASLMTDVACAARELAGEHPEAAAALGRFVEIEGAHPLSTLEELYCRAFDLAPVCAPYVSVHLFGEEGWRRAELMAGLEGAYARIGFDRGSELADHLAVLLRAVPLLPQDEAADLFRHCLVGPIRTMGQLLGRAGSSYTHILEAARVLVDAASGLHPDELARVTAPRTPSQTPSSCRAASLQEEHRA
jgi:nitrate reductase assembly molybdenum cofactor insertion protein NarJ